MQNRITKKLIDAVNWILLLVGVGAILLGFLPVMPSNVSMVLMSIGASDRKSVV
jgi:hypothetical protein